MLCPMEMAMEVDSLPPADHLNGTSYATNIFDQLAGFKLLRMTKSHDRTIIKTCEGLSDLKYHRSETSGKYYCWDTQSHGWFWAISSYLNRHSVSVSSSFNVTCMMYIKSFLVKTFSNHSDYYFPLSQTNLIL